MKYLARVIFSMLATWSFAASAGDWKYANPAEVEAGTAPRLVASSAERLSAAGIAAPTNNMTMERVRQDFGQPSLEMDPVGRPAITRWRYTDYTVYFEIDRVIVSVIN